jgi:hypothetical protein
VVEVIGGVAAGGCAIKVDAARDVVVDATLAGGLDQSLQAEIR